MAKSSTNKQTFRNFLFSVGKPDGPHAVLLNFHLNYVKRNPYVSMLFILKKSIYFPFFLNNFLSLPSNSVVPGSDSMCVEKMISGFR